MNTDRALSYVHGAGATPLTGATVGAVFERIVAAHSDTEALVSCHQGIRWTYAELAGQVDILARGLLALGLAPGERLGLWSANRAEWIVTQFAAAKAGIVLVNLNPAYRVAELEHALVSSGCRALLVEPTFKSSDYIAMLVDLMPEITHCEVGNLHSARCPELRHLLAFSDQDLPGFHRYESVVQRGAATPPDTLAAIAAELQFDDPINIQFTSGTTGLPKAATLTHHNIVNNAFFSGLRMGLTQPDRLCIPVPMYHCFGMVLGSLMCVTHAATMVLTSAGFDAGAALAAVESERCTAIHGVPTMFIAELEHPDFANRDLGSLRTGIIAGAPCPIELMRRLIDEMHLSEITIAYGMTETGPVSFQTAPDDSIDRRVGSVGRVLDHTEIKIVDDEGRVVPRGKPGELLTRGYCVMPGYWDNEAKTRETIDSAGWLWSGDVAVIDDDGYCEIVGRTKDMLIRGGENIFPREIEAFLFTHPKVAQAEIVGVPDAKYGEEICAWVQLHQGASATANEIREFCRDNIAHFKIPRYVLFTEDFPLTATGKVQKFKLRDQAVDVLGLDASA